MLSAYEAETAIHEGLRHTVYRARRRSDGAPVILKLMKQAMPTEAQVAAFRLEYEAMAQLDSERIPRALGFEEDQQRWMLVEEDIGGRSLREQLGADLSLLESLDVAIALLEAAQALHAGGVIHKDINPNNIVWNRQTGALQLIDFGIATLLASEAPAFSNDTRLEGTLAYLAPEQTGRVRAVVDYRADLYAIGVTLYELFCGLRPFDATEALDLVHCHIARRPVEPARHGVSETLSALIMRLLEKRAEDRYRSAYGVLRDLQRCRQGVVEGGAIEVFEIGLEDLADTFMIPRRLYGREAAVEQLGAALQQASEPAHGQLVLVQGGAGMGKTALIQELYRPLTERRGTFVSGKSDQFSTSPLSSMVDALEALVSAALAGSESELTALTGVLRRALGPNGRVLTDIVPKAELLIGPQPEVGALGPTEHRNRLAKVLCDFVHVFARADQPVVLFLDDLQWVDGASLHLLEQLVLDERPGLLLVGAFRDKEVDHAHPLQASLGRLGEAGAAVQHLQLSGLTLVHVQDMLCRASGASPEEARPLAELVLRNTEGNPLWVTEYLESLAVDGLITLDREAGRWSWRLEEIEREGFTESVLELLVGKIQRIPEPSQRALQVAACIGNRFALARVAALTERSAEAVFEDLLPALNSGILVATSGADAHLECAFFHDRLQQAAASMLAPDALERVHYGAGRLLLEASTPEARDERIFDIVGHLNRGRALVPPSGRVELAQLNLEAGSRARAANAFTAAEGYLGVGLESLPEDAWAQHHGLSMALHREQALATLMMGEGARSDALLDAALEHSTGPLQQVDLLVDRVHQYTTSARYAEALEAMRRGLALLGSPMPSDEALPEEMGRLHESLMARLGERSPASLADNPEMSDAVAGAKTRLLAAAVAPAFYTGPVIYSVVIFKAMDLCLEFGNPPSAFIYPFYGHLLSGIYGDRRGGFEFGLLGMELAERRGARQDACLSAFVTAYFLASWVQPLRLQRAIGELGVQAGLESGDLTYAGYLLVYMAHNAYYEGKPLERVAEEARGHAAFHHKIGNAMAIDATDACRMTLANLLGQTEGVHDFTLGDLDEAAFVARSESNGSLMAIAYMRIMKAEVLLRHGEPAAALVAIDEAEPLLPNIMNNHANSRWSLVGALAACALPEARGLAGAQATVELFAGWAAECPENFAHLHALLKAELARVEGRTSEAIAAYEEAIRLAEENGLLGDLAWAQELAGRFWLAQKRQTLGMQYIALAHYGYGRWGAKLHVAQLEAEFPMLALRQPAALSTWTSTRTGSTGSGVLDLASVVEASQAISGEIHLDRLLERLMRLVLQTAGAERGTLATEHLGELWVQASGTVEGGALEVQVAQGEPVEAHPALPGSVTSYVLRTGEPLVLTEAGEDRRFAKDPYVLEHAPRSVLCMPLHGHGGIIGLLYLENRGISGAFGEGRLSTLRLLASQFTISFGNAQLYGDMERQVAARTAQLAEKNEELETTLQELNAAHARLVHAEKMASLGQLTAGIAHEINNPLNFVNNFSVLGLELLDEVGEVLAEGGDDARTEATDILGDLRRNLGAISTHGKRAADIVSSMLMHARADGSERSATDLNALLRQYVDLAEFGLRERRGEVQIDIELDLAEDLPPVLLSPQSIGRVLVNLLNNAHDAVSDRGRGVEGFHGLVRMETRAVDGGVEVVVSDNGGGIPEALRDKIFEPFFTTKAGTSGTGLGLSLCYDIIVQGHGGRMSLAPSDGEGATFTLRLGVEHG